MAGACVLVTILVLQPEYSLCQGSGAQNGLISGMMTSIFSLLANESGGPGLGGLESLNLSSSSLDTISMETLQNALVASGNTPSVDSTCAKHVDLFLQALQNHPSPTSWSVKMIDAIGKPPSGVLNMKFNWLGDWDECVQAVATVHDNVTDSDTHPFTGKYCTVTIPVPIPQLRGRMAGVSIGICVPNTCSASDVQTLLQAASKLLPGNITLPDPTVSCQEPEQALDTRAIVAIVICSLFLAVMVLATAFDVVYVHWLAKLNTGTDGDADTQAQVNSGFSGLDDSLKDGLPASDTGAARYDVTPTGTPRHTAGKYKPGTAGRLLLSFSVFTNGTKLLSTQQPKGALTAINGIRFLSMTWVIIGHGFSFLFTPVPENGLKYGRELLQRREFAAIFNANFSVDTFFLLSGLLVSYLTLKELQKRNGAKKFDWKLFYFHRFWRLTPPYMMALMLYVCLLSVLANGPMWRQEGHANRDCTHGWWKNLLYVNNLVRGGDNQLGCMQWTWYMANDMQFYIISPLMLVPLYYSPLWGGLSCLGFLLVNLVSSGVVSTHYGLPVSNMFDSKKAQIFTWQYYVKPWCRVGPYVVGIFTGYLLYRYKQSAKIPRVVNVLGWLMSITLGCLIIYGIYSEDLTNPFSQPVSSFINATVRCAWGACVAWVIFASANGYGGPINHFLSWPGFVPLARLTYFAYLVHPMMEEVYIYGLRQTPYVYDYLMVYMMLGHICTSYAAAFLLSLAFESPMMGLEKVLLGREKHS